MPSAATATVPEPTPRPPAGRVRLTERRDFHANVRALPLDGRLAPAGGVVVDISQDGLFVSSVRELPPDSLVLLQIYSPRRQGMLRLMGRVVHNRQGEGFGCRFIDLEYSQRRELQRLLS